MSPEVIAHWEGSGEVTCRGCGRLIHLWFNGGELDVVTCCGRRYRSEVIGYQLVIEQLEDVPAVD
jgi:hypothetical protein